MKSALPLLPALLVTAVLFGGGLILSVLQSLEYAPAMGSSGLSFAAYRELFADRAFWQGLVLSAWVAGVSTLGAAVLGTTVIVAANPTDEHSSASTTTHSSEIDFFTLNPRNLTSINRDEVPPWRT